MTKYNCNKNQFSDIHKRLDHIVLQLEVHQHSNPGQLFLTEEEFCQVLNITKSTARALRDSSLISYSIVGNNYQYCISDIISFLHVNQTSAKL